MGVVWNILKPTQRNSKSTINVPRCLCGHEERRDRTTGNMNWMNIGYLGVGGRYLCFFIDLHVVSLCEINTSSFCGFGKTHKTCLVSSGWLPSWLSDLPRWDLGEPGSKKNRPFKVEQLWWPGPCEVGVWAGRDPSWPFGLMEKLGLY